ncbi:MAG TPA: hypothetical protein VLA09_02490 [Longimicrobiales bacterium]|nr:hypothetical protein [Longimicrobiales bacterium]
MRTTVDIEPHLLNRLRDGAHAKGISFKAMLNRTLRLGLEVAEPASAPYECPTFSMGSPLRPLEKALAAADALEDEEVAREMAHRR